MDLFIITCTTCKSRLKVRDPAAVGQILACPKCGGMVMVKPPPAYVDASDQKSDLPTATEVEGPALRVDQTFDSAAFDAVEELLSDAPPKIQSPAVAKAPAAAPPAKRSATPPSPTAIPSAPPKPRFVGGPPPTNKGTGAAPSKNPAPAGASAPAVPAKPKPAAASDSKRFAPPPPAEMDSGPSPPAGPIAALQAHRRHWLLVGGSVLLGVVLVLSAVAAAVHFFREPAAGQAAVPKNTVSQPTAINAATPAAPDSIPDSAASESATVATTPEIRTEASSPVAKTGSPVPATTDTTDPLGLTKEPSPAQGPVKPTADPLAKFDRLIADRATDPLAKPTDRPAEPTSAVPPPDTTPPKPLAPRPPPREVDIARRLADPLQAIDTPGTPLADFVQLMSDLSTIPITLQADALPLIRASAETAVVVHATNATVGGAMQQAFAALGLEFTEADDQLLVRVAEPAVLNTYAYPMKNLAEDPESMAALAEILQAVVEHGSWGDQADHGSISVDAVKGVLAIRQRQAVHAILVFLCEKLRTARGKPHASSRFDPSFFTLDTRSARAKARLETSISLNYGQPTRLVTVLQRLGEAAHVRILVDWHDVASAGWNPAGEATLVISNQPLAAALDTLLEPLDLTWRIIDSQTLQVVTPARLAEQGELELYKIDTLASDEAAAEALLGKIRSALGEAVFRDAGGNGQIRYEPESKCLLAWLPQPKQRELEALLSKWRAEGGK